ncbi:hypothetical protein AB1N83_004071 [Pleurotus pulmonarius]
MNGTSIQLQVVTPISILPQRYTPGGLRTTANDSTCSGEHMILQVFPVGDLLIRPRSSQLSLKPLPKSQSHLCTSARKMTINAFRAGLWECL